MWAMLNVYGKLTAKLPCKKLYKVNKMTTNKVFHRQRSGQTECAHRSLKRYLKVVIGERATHQ